MKLEAERTLDNGSLSVVLAKANGAYLWDVDGNKFIDMVAGVSSINQGHNHPKIKQALVDQLDTGLSQCSRNFHHNQFAVVADYLCELTGYDKVHFMSSGNEIAEAAVRFARKWGVEKKGIKPGHAQILHPRRNYWGRSIAASAASQNPMLQDPSFGPLEHHNFPIIEFGDLEALEQAFKTNPNIAAYFMEPILGEAGVVIPPKGYYTAVRQLCNKYNVLWICDEVQVGIGRTGTFWCHMSEGVKADMMISAKSLTGGMYPVSALFANNEVMDLIKFGSHGGTFGGCPLGLSIVKKSIEVAIEENISKNSEEKGEYLLKNLKEMADSYDFIKEVRGRGLFIAIEFDVENLPITTFEVCLKIKENGILCKDFQKRFIKLTPTLVINWEDCDQIIHGMNRAFESINNNSKK